MATPGQCETTMTAGEVAELRTERLVALSSGELLSNPEERNEGVVTDAGLHDWNEVEGFWSFSKNYKRWIFTPVDKR